MFSSRSIQQIAASVPTVFVFRVTGHVDDKDLEGMATFMDSAFERFDTVDMLVDLTAFTGSDPTAMFDGDVMGVQVASLTNVNRYAVVGAPAMAAMLIRAMDKIIPVEARVFDAEDREAAWQFIDAQPVPRTGP